MTWHRSALLAILIVPLALWTRWNGAPEPKGARFHPWPDAVEYAAEAQALARSGEVYLQIGPQRVRPRYPPGWPMLIAPAIWLGTEGQDLWRLTALFGAALAWFLAVVAAKTTEALSPPEERTGVAPFVAGLLAGCVWALAPIAVDLGSLLMSDEPAALASLAGLVLTGAGLLRQEGRVSWMLALGGLAFGLTAAMRPISALMMAPPALLVLLGCVRRSGVRTALRRSLPWLAGAAVFPAITVLVMLRSGWPAWEWSGYRFWVPERFDRLAHAFNLHFALDPDTTFRREGHGRPLSHLDLAARVLLGLPGLRVRHYLGLLWPIAGWLAALPLLRAARRRGGDAAEIAAWMAPALLLWILEHVAVFSLYFYPASRFYLAPVAVCAVLSAAACGLGLASPYRRSRLLAGAAAALILFFTLQSFLALRSEPLPKLKRDRTRANFTRWLQMSDERRAGRPMPFDPIHAQALGLLTPEVAAGIHEWGELPDTMHVRRLRRNGCLPAGGPHKALTPWPPLPALLPPPPGRGGTIWKALFFSLLSPVGGWRAGRGGAGR